EGTALGHNILGLENDLKGISQADIKEFTKKHYTTSNTVIAISGNYTEKKVRALAQKIFGRLAANPWERTSVTDLNVQAKKVSQTKTFNQPRYVMASQGYSIYDEQKTGLFLLTNLLGGFGISSIHNLTIREKYGIAYKIKSTNSLYSDT